jgi:hypothetical protein
MKNILILSVTIFLFTSSTSYGQSIKTQQTKVDSSLVYINATIKAIRKCCISILTTPPYKYIAISSKYPMIINISASTDQTAFKKEDYVPLGIIDNFQVDVFSKTFLTAVGNVVYGMDFSSGSFDGGGYIQSGEYEFKGGLLVSGKPISFDNLKIRFEDDKSLWKLNEGAKCVFDGKEYYYRGSSWIAPGIK